MEYRDHSLGSKRPFDWKKLGTIFTVIVVLGLALAVLFFKFRPAIVAWRDEALAPYHFLHTHPTVATPGSIGRPRPSEKPAAPVGALTASQISAIESWTNDQRYALKMDTFQWSLVRGPDPITRDFKVSLDVRVNWHQTGSLQPQQQVCKLVLQEYRDRDDNRIWQLKTAEPGTVCNYAAGQ